MMCGNALNSRGKPAVSPMSVSPTFDIDKKNRNGANLKLRHALRAGGVIRYNVYTYQESRKSCDLPHHVARDQT